MAARGRILRRAAFVLVGLPVAVLALIAGRLAYGPIALDFLRPTLERALGAADGSFAVRLGSTELAWDRVDREPQLRVRDVRVVGQGGNEVATADTVVLRLAIRPLLRGVIAPADVRLLEPRLEIARREDGTFDLGVGAEGGATDRRLDVRALVDRMAGATPGGTTAPSLREFSARGATIEITDRSYGRSWRLEGADLRLGPDAAGLVGSLVGRLRVADRTVPVRSIARYRPRQERGTIAVRFRGLDPELFASVGLHMPLDGAVVASVDAALRPIDVRGHIRGSAGRLTIPALASEPIDVDSLRAKGRFDARARRLQMQRLTLAHGIARVHLPGILAWNEGGQVTVDARASGERLPLETLGHWWPTGLAPPVRQWVVEHLRGGIVQAVDLELQGTIGGAQDRVAVEPVRGTIAFENIAVRLDNRFPPVTDLTGTARVDQGALTVRAEHGRMGTIEVIGASATIPLTGAPNAHTQLTVACRGPMAEALALLDREPFGYARALGIAPADVSGTTTAHLVVGVPHGAPRTGARPTVTGSAQLTGVGLPRVPGGPSMSDGEIALELEDGRLRATGTARLAGAPISVAWEESTTASAGPTRHVTVTGRLDSMNRAALGWDLSPWIEGPVDLEAKLVTSANGSGSLDLHVGLDDATVAPPFPHLRKPAGVAGNANGRVTLVKNVITRIERFTLAAGPSTVTGSASRDGSGWLSASLQATVAGFSSEPDGHYTLEVQRQQNGHGFRLSSEDAGNLFDAIVGDDRLDGGRFVLEGTAQATDGHLVLAGTLDAQSVVLQRSPVLARVVTLASLAGIRRALEGEGVPFDRVGAKLEYRVPHLSIRDGLAHGKSLAIGLDGTIDPRAETADLRGTVVPSYYGLNTVPGRIPVLGEMVGGKAEAVQAIDFTVTGGLADPRVQVKPVSTLAPGVLRDLLQKLRE